MSDRSLRLLRLPPQSAQGGKRGAVLLRERPASPPDAPSDKKSGDEQSGGTQDDNPFAPPPEGTPDRPWQPRRPADGESGDGSDDPDSPWGSQWSDRQPGRSPGGFGERPGRPPSPGPEGQGGNTPGSGMRWDPTDASQRRARFALLSGMWAFFFALFSWPYVALLLGALALYWGVSSLRTKPGKPEPTGTPPARPQTTAAVTGLVTASLAIALVAATFTAQLVYSDYYSCTNDALTNQAKQSCTQLLPKELRGVLGTNG
ncbi:MULTISPECIES: hypothetical protein [unclassified Streptomyces]|uniref:hypothetical protein n=1 Tax=unclassified Streptomyces TaxID=2593676 RepID=UPI00224EE940|nr:MULTISPECIES: hypothetical protein [unclassified Streptomyces]MCX5050531.1 hypothetical protein [Streptomyces sp. NBC_00474]MCX5060908.1 hypothetical protein [Streptomyces sp. NBC_00452]MCX5293467.1 hypothetical protein [Streptomyces sp. NBC_00183]